MNYHESFEWWKWHTDGLWPSEITHLYHLAKQENIEMTIASIRGGKVPIDPESLRPMLTDRITKKYWNDEKFWKILENTPSLAEISW